MNNKLQALHKNLSGKEARMQGLRDSLRTLECEELEKRKAVDGFERIVELQRRQPGFLNGIGGIGMGMGMRAGET